MLDALAPSTFSVSVRRALGALATGTLAAGAFVARRRFTGQRDAVVLPPALDAPLHDLPVLEGVTRYYHRPGVGRPFVLLPDLHMAGSAMDVKPLFAHLAAATPRPILVPDWLGFGLSERPDRRYVPGLFQRQLRLLLERAGEPADIVAFGLSGVYAAAVAVARPEKVHKLMLVAPSGLAGDPEQPFLRRVLVGLSGGTGTFRLYFRRLSNPESLQAYFAEHLFYTGAPIPDELFGYALLTTHVPGADHATQRLAQGLLDMHLYATLAFERLPVPARLVLPALTDEMAPLYSRVPTVVRANAQLSVEAMKTGLMPQWEQPDAFAGRVEAWFAPDKPARRRAK